MARYKYKIINTIVISNELLINTTNGCFSKLIFAYHSLNRVYIF